MSQKANPTAIGIFVVTATLLAMVALVMVTSGNIFSRKDFLILYFEDNVNGLKQGSLVKYKGVTIGQVSQIYLKFNQADDDNHIPVIVQMDSELIKAGAGSPINFRDRETLQTMIENGLRAKLEIESLLTGMLYIDIDRRNDPEKPVFHQLKEEYPEIPTIPSTMTKVKNAFADIDIVEMVQNLNSLLSSTQEAISGLDTPEINQELLSLLESIRNRIDSEDVIETLASTRSTMENIRELTEKLKGKIEPATEGLQSTSNEISMTLTQLRTALDQIRNLLSPNSSLVVELEDSIKRFGIAARNVGELADLLNRHPGAVISGKPTTEFTR